MIQQRNPAPERGKPYSEVEDLTIVAYLIRGEHTNVGGRLIWQNMKRDVIPSKYTFFFSIKSISLK